MKEILNHLIEHKTLSKEQAKGVLKEMTSGEVNTSQMAAFLTIFMMRSVRVEELMGFREAMLERCIAVDIPEYDAIDLCGTGGDGKDTFNVSTLASFIVAGAGQPVAKHGNVGVSSVCGSSNLLAHFGYEFTNDVEQLKSSLDNAGICFLHAPLFHPAMKHIGPVRKELGVKTFFNMLGPMVNPSFPKKQLVGVFSLELARLYGYLYQNNDVRFSILHALDGYDEVSLTGDLKWISNDGEKIVSPEELGFKTIMPETIKGGTTIEESADIFMNILKGKGSPEQEAVVIANATLALTTSKPNWSLDTARDKATETLKNGTALKVFKELINPKTSINIS
ncbi:anthranilate phosphoribosyltransferase [Cyclobacterium marinum]|uniref:Anthranilate phosphoribosyltransferase n=1 Tax=Cyclobacterium marinum (strain ATCC 25205 / DSM 745 / LMG 13164 / NCIMB 1802) TaxID=880070 RepID=G0J685_CYCMS|nr:anthranilate phosphoribosyltransferase [Cyclobacterium marinum]AEL26837.1 Anthranilate phosphoribosyltransferase [Cyclobacterium marinum DSM 745]